MSRHVQNTDVSVLERRLRPIYEWLDVSNNKKALQECEKVLKKTPNLQCAKALKALTLYRMGKDFESHNIVEKLIEEKPTDEATLQAITLYFRERHEFYKNNSILAILVENICKLYETAVKQDPTNEELHTHLFMSYVRIFDFKAQQQSAMALYKQKPKNPYYCWAVMSIVLQATRGEGCVNPQKKQLLLSLAERMIVKMIQENKMDAEQEVQLYIIVLQSQDKYQEILDILDGPLGEKLQNNLVTQYRFMCYRTMERWADINILNKNLLTENIDAWDLWTEYIHSAFQLYKQNADNQKNPSEEQENIDNTPEKCHEFICGMIEGGSGTNYQLRGPYLARFALIAMLQQTNHTNIEELLGDTTELFIEYFRKFGEKAACVYDLKIYLSLLDPEKRLDLSAKLIKEVGISSLSVPQTTDQMQRHICALQLSRLCGGHKNLSIDHLKALVTALSLHYQHGYQSYGKDLLPTDMGLSDNYAILAAHVLYDISVQEKTSDSLIVALAILENLLKNSTSNFHAKLLAVKFYQILGDGVNANSMVFNLDLKHLQLDSLGYVYCGRLITTGLFSLCSIHYDTTMRFFHSNDSTDHLTFSYKFGSFNKLHEFMDFRERMNNSLHFATVLVDRTILYIMECSTLEGLYITDISPKYYKADWDMLRDNRDANVYVNWEPTLLNYRYVEQHQVFKDLFEQDLNFLKLRTRILWSLHAATEIVLSNDGTRQKHVEKLREILDEWKSATEELSKTTVKQTSEDLVVFPLPSRYFGYIETPYLKVISTFLEFLMSLSVENVDSAEKLVKACEYELENLTDFLEKKTLPQSTDFREKRKSLEFAVNTVEILCMCCAICLMCHDISKPRQNKKGKKKPENNKSYDLSSMVVGKLKTAITKIGDTIDVWANKTDVRDLTSILESLSLVQGNSGNLYTSINDSYLTSNKEIQLVLKNKLKMLSNL